MLLVVENGGMLDRRARIHAEQQHVAGRGVGDLRFQQMASGGREQRLGAAALGPVRRVGRRRLGLGAVERAPDAAH
jgi:hypothetical protein